ncbi:hypothetical protein DEFDS_P118 (plasmid) [Deferribacter desulfuricans SSM1]|uniref:Uncharacterized protein n=1 Tax=Deferribacter desulfuricans (strain DSM 14783 / JCM 11476 / NBRC 101012 / SSM1) TaxID=639282 RepID=D3PEU8_DEFDS|nr:hypothetical protein [Deferribacter desulfuricans]BAI81740.1 hypothetical protein DEFDS_P118 [Deferribacter desulfuricans SSM1]
MYTKINNNIQLLYKTIEKVNELESTIITDIINILDNIIGNKDISYIITFTDNKFEIELKNNKSAYSDFFYIDEKGLDLNKLKKVINKILNK